jgi:hypothetical protein
MPVCSCLQVSVPAHPPTTPKRPPCTGLHLTANSQDGCIYTRQNTLHRAPDLAPVARPLARVPVSTLGVDVREREWRQQPQQRSIRTNKWRVLFGWLPGPLIQHGGTCRRGTPQGEGAAAQGIGDGLLSWAVSHSAPCCNTRPFMILRMRACSKPAHLTTRAPCGSCSLSVWLLV